MRRIQTQEKQKFEEEHIKRSRKMAAECVILLKSDGTLPLADVVFQKDGNEKGFLFLRASGTCKRGGLQLGRCGVR